MKMIDLGYTYDTIATVDAKPSEPENRKHYPLLTLDEKSVDKFSKVAQVGDTYTAMVKLKCTSCRENSYGSSMGFDVLEMSDLASAPNGGEENVLADDAEEEKDEE